MLAVLWPKEHTLVPIKVEFGKFVNKFISMIISTRSQAVARIVWRYVRSYAKNCRVT